MQRGNIWLNFWSLFMLLFSCFPYALLQPKKVKGLFLILYRFSFLHPQTLLLTFFYLCFTLQNFILALLQMIVHMIFVPLLNMQSVFIIVVIAKIKAGYDGVQRDQQHMSSKFWGLNFMFFGPSSDKSIIFSE